MADQPRQYRLGKWIFYALLILVIVPAAVFALWAWSTLNYTYSTGERSGFVQKISQKGWVCKTWEGELAMVNLPGAMPEIFKFSVRDEAVVKNLQETMGQRVVLKYDQHPGIPTSCFGETEYFAVEVHAVSTPAATTSPSSPVPAPAPAPSPVDSAH